jgi:hypothetical protein
MVTRTKEYKGYSIEAFTYQDHDSPEWVCGFRIEPEPEALRTVYPTAKSKLPTSTRWPTSERALSAAVMEACAVIDIQVKKAP